MTAQELLLIARQGRPGVRYVTNKKQTAIGAWSEAHGRYVAVAMKEISEGRWVSLEYECLVNGQPPVQDWDES